MNRWCKRWAAAHCKRPMASSPSTPFATSPARPCTWRWSRGSGAPTRGWPGAGGRAEGVVRVRVHEPLSVLDALGGNRSMHSWDLNTGLQYLAAQGKGVAVLLNCGESAEQLLAQFEGRARAAQAPERGRMDLRTHGVGAQILRECGVHRMALMGQPRRMPSMPGYGLEITGFIPKE